MDRLLRHTVWFSRLVLAAATFLFAMIAVRGVIDPVGSSAVHQITFGSSEGVTVARVGFGGFPLTFAFMLFFCLLSSRRLLAGLWTLLLVAVVVTVVRVLGIVLDGPAPFTMHVLKPEIGLVILSATALLFERRRHATYGMVLSANAAH